jgi:hypothetical protein
VFGQRRFRAGEPPRFARELVAVVGNFAAQLGDARTQCLPFGV